MTQNEVVWFLISILQLGVVSFVAYWTRRVQRLEDAMTQTIEMRTHLLIEYQGRLSRLEAQYTEIIKSLARIERNIEHHVERDLANRSEEEDE